MNHRLTVYSELFTLISKIVQLLMLAFKYFKFISFERFLFRNQPLIKRFTEIDYFFKIPFFGRESLIHCFQIGLALIGRRENRRF